MPKVVITHAVEDVDHWLRGKAERATAIESAGGSNVTDYVGRTGRTRSPSQLTYPTSRASERCWRHRRPKSLP